MTYRIEVKESAMREIAAMPKRDRRRAVRAIAALADEPRPQGVRKLTGIKDAYRLRVGDYRIIYQIADDVLTVFVVRVGNRKDIYRRK